MFLRVIKVGKFQNNTTFANLFQKGHHNSLTLQVTQSFRVSQVKGRKLLEIHPKVDARYNFLTKNIIFVAVTFGSTHKC